MAAAWRDHVEESPGSVETGCRVTPGQRKLMESAAENKLPVLGSEKVKRCGKSAPQVWQQYLAW